MNYLSVAAIFDPGHVKATQFRDDDGVPHAVIRLDAHDGPSLSLHLNGLAEVAELEAALAQSREYLTTELAASDAA